MSSRPCRTTASCGSTSTCPRPAISSTWPSWQKTPACLGTHEFFDDPLLLALIDQGLIGNQELRKLAENIQIANNEVRARRGLLFPFVGIGARAGLEKRSLFTPLGAADEQLTFPGGGNFPDPVPNFLTAADFSWQIDIWRQLRNSRDASILRFYGTRDGVNYVVTRLVADIAENYYTLMALDQQLLTLNNTIEIQEKSIEIAKARKGAARDNELPVQRFQAEVRKNQSEKFIIAQQIIEVENKINFLVGRYPQTVDRASAAFLDLKLPELSLGAPSDLLANRADIRQAERELRAAGLDVRVARAEFFPKLTLTAGVGYEAFNTRYLFVSPESLVYNAAGNLVAPLVNKSAIRAEYLTANARQLQGS
jgi:multidrug efflux system outer membrane protein